MKFMEKMHTEIINIVAMQFELKPETVSMETHLELDLGADSIDLIMLVIEFENTYGVSIPVEELSFIYSPQRVVEIIKKKL